MRRSLQTMVLDVLAAHLEVPVSSLSPAQNLQKDLGIPPLGLVLIALDIEDIENVQLPFERLGDVKTIEDLSRFLESAMPAPLSPSVLRGAVAGGWPE
jgi:acyl carrier protein